MKSLLVRNQRLISLSLLAALALPLILSACAGGAQINFTYDPTTGAGSGNIQITPGSGGQATSSGGSVGGGSAATSQLVLFGVVVALLIGVLAVVLASGRRRRIE